MPARHALPLATIGLLTIALGCGPAGAPTAPAALPARHVLALDDSGLQDIRADLPARIEAADAPSLLVQPPATRAFGLLAWSPRPSWKPSRKPSRRPSTRPSRYHSYDRGAGYDDRVYVAEGPAPIDDFRYDNYLSYPIEGGYYYPYAYHAQGNYYSPYAYQNPQYAYSYSPFLYNNDPYYYYGLGANPTTLALPAATVTISSATGFEPASVVIRAGGTVSWTNGDAVVHAAVADASGANWTGDVAPGQASAAVGFALPGAYPYHCPYHPELRATVVVQ